MDRLRITTPFERMREGCGPRRERGAAASKGWAGTPANAASRLRSLQSGVKRVKNESRCLTSPLRCAPARVCVLSRSYRLGFSRRRLLGEARLDEPSNQRRRKRLVGLESACPLAGVVSLQLVRVGRDG